MLVPRRVGRLIDSQSAFPPLSMEPHQKRRTEKNQLQLITPFSLVRFCPFAWWKVFFQSEIAQISSFTLAYIPVKYLFFSRSIPFFFRLFRPVGRFLCFVISFIRRSTFMGFLFMFIFFFSFSHFFLYCPVFSAAGKVEEEVWLKAKRFFARTRWWCMGQMV